ncbi:hypothetical protein [Streptomyces sp. NPDC057694]|uniref:hypothetical protein n=1 Tax=Streptomyces sp. NPDC057694 TaxID=3346216 RepID=UPI0036B6E740
MEPIAADLLMAFAGSTAGAAGHQAWQSLRALVIRRPGEEGHGQRELTALTDEPGRREHAQALAAALASRAEQDPEFARLLEAWRQEHGTLRTGAGDVRNDISGTVHGPVVTGRDFNGPITLG